MNEHKEDKIVAQLSEMLALKCGFHPDVAKRLRSAALFHDIGKQKIPESIINKPGKLTPQEFEIMKTHTTHGEKMLESVQGELGVMARTICANHHEQWDGNGYWKKHSCDLPVYVPIVSICDVFVALLSVRSYKPAWPPEEVIEYIYQHTGTQFGFGLASTFVALVRHDIDFRELFLETGGR